MACASISISLALASRSPADQAVTAFSKFSQIQTASSSQYLPSVLSAIPIWAVDSVLYRLNWMVVISCSILPLRPLESSTATNDERAHC